MLKVVHTLRSAMMAAMFLPHGIASAQADAGPLTRIQFDAMLARVDSLFVAAPLRIRSGTGSPLNPLAVF